MAKIKVYPTSANAMVIKHPIDGRLLSDGVEWTEDGFTARCLMDGAITTDRSRAHRSGAVRDQSVPPPHATAVQTAQPPVITRRAK